MPNYFSNSFFIHAVTPDQWQGLASSFWEGFLSTFYPEPDCSAMPTENGDLPSQPDDNGIAHFLDEELDNRWYDRRNKHWGTKWDDCNHFDEIKEGLSTEFSTGFDTTWAPLGEECLEVISLQFLGFLVFKPVQVVPIDPRQSSNSAPEQEASTEAETPVVKDGRFAGFLFGEEN